MGAWIDGIEVGHFTDPRRPTGCTVVLVRAGAVCGVDVRGGAPGTRETDLLDPVNTVGVVHAVVLGGGSAFGLDAASGVVRWLEERGIGFEAGPVRVPIVPAAILFDLHVGDPAIRPDAAAGYAAADAARGGQVDQGNVGAGAGATVGKLFGLKRAMKGGFGSATVRRADGVMVSAHVAVNALGDVLDETGAILAGARTEDGAALVDARRAVRDGAWPPLATGPGNTTLGVVATNVRLTKAEATKVAQMAHDGLARAIAPIHTPWDGDTMFAMSTGALVSPEPVLLVGALAAEAVAAAVRNAVLAARSLPGLPAAVDPPGATDVRLERDGVVVRDFREEDAAALVPLADDREVWRNLRDAFPHPYTIDDAHAFIARMRARSPRTAFAVEVGGAFAGGIGYFPGHDVERVGAETGYWLGRPFQGRGVATTALRLLVDHVFTRHPELQRIWAVPFAWNPASARVLEKAGFQLEGTMRRSALKDGQLLDQRLYARLRD